MTSDFKILTYGAVGIANLRILNGNECRMITHLKSLLKNYAFFNFSSFYAYDNHIFLNGIWNRLKKKKQKK